LSGGTQFARRGGLASSTHLPVFALPAPVALSQLPPLSNSHCTTLLHHRDDNARPVYDASVCASPSETTTRVEFGIGHLNYPSPSLFSHDHITNEQNHVAESTRHTLNPTGARARERRGARKGKSGDLNYRSASDSTRFASAICIAAVVAVDEETPHDRPSNTAEVQNNARDHQPRCPEQAWQSCHHRPHRRRLLGRPRSPRRGNTSASSATEPSAEASTAAGMSDPVSTAHPPTHHLPTPPPAGAHRRPHLFLLPLHLPTLFRHQANHPACVQTQKNVHLSASSARAHSFDATCFFGTTEQSTPRTEVSPFTVTASVVVGPRLSGALATLRNRQ